VTVAAAAVAVAVERNKLPKQQDPTPVELYQFHSGNIGTGLICKQVKLEGINFDMFRTGWG
jgi:hypothetical protein